MERYRRLVPTLSAIALVGVFLADDGMSTAARCTMVAAPAQLLLHVEQDTTLPFVSGGRYAMSYSSVRPGTHDTLLALAGTPMPAARVRLLRLDSTTRAALHAAGVPDSMPEAFIRAAPYRADCATIRYTDSVPWTVAGDTGYARATLTPRDQWVHGRPVFVISNTWSYPYPRQRGVAPYGTPPTQPLAPARTVFDLMTRIASEPASPSRSGIAGDSAARATALIWARTHAADAELEPLRTTIRNTVLATDRERLMQMPSRLRGSYEVTLQAGGTTETWFFRTTERPSYSWRDLDTNRTTADVVATPYVGGYQLIGYAAPTRDSLVLTAPRGMETRNAALVWLASTDRPTAPGNTSARVLRGELQFRRRAAPPTVWDALDGWVPPLGPMERLQLSRFPPIPRENEQPALLITLHIDSDGAVRADTTLVRGGVELRVQVRQLDTVSVKRPF